MYSKNKYKIKKINESTEPKFKHYLVELEESDIAYTRITPTKIIIQMDYNNDSVMGSDTESFVDFDSRYEYIKQEEEYLKMVKRFIDMIKYDYNVKIVKTKSFLDFEIVYFEKNRDKKYYDIDKNGSVVIDEEHLKKILPIIGVESYPIRNKVKETLVLIFGEDVSLNELEVYMDTLSEINEVDKDVDIVRDVNIKGQNTISLEFLSGDFILKKN